LQDWKLQDWKMTDEVAGVEFAELENYDEVAAVKIVELEYNRRKIGGLENDTLEIGKLTGH